MKIRHLILVCLGVVGCSRVQWVETTEGVYLYGKLPKHKDVVWTGGTLGPLASGKGDVVILGKDGTEKSRATVTVSQGAIFEYNYIPIENGSYLGKRKKNVPCGFGVLIRRDTLMMGIFKKGELASGEVGIYALDGNMATPCYQGAFKKGKPNGVGRAYKDGNLIYEGSFRKGARHGIGKGYENTELVYDGSFSNGRRDGYGKAFTHGVLTYDGAWHKGLRDGQGTAYNDRGLMVYSGGWENDQYQGKGKLYENGQCIEGKWDEGRLVKSISTSVLEEIGSATRIWLSDKDSLDLTSVSKE